jgi:pimeloyl-ACP methyl ester carboxylesterase
MERPARARPGRGALGALAVTVAIALLAISCGTPAPSSFTQTGQPSASADISAAPSPAASPTPVPPRLVSWSDCGRGFECGFVDVPLDYAVPDSPVERVSLIRLRATDPVRRIGSLLVNPGGPGESGVDFVQQDAARIFSPAILARFDIVGFDPRGVGSSTPIRCLDNLDHFIPADLTGGTPASLADLLAGSESFARQCGERNAAELPYLGTENVARDLDEIRAALGDAKLTYLGFSYGTLIGEDYASLFPSRIRALALDGVVDPSLDQATFRQDQAVAFEGALDRFMADCSARASCAFHSGGRAAAAFDALIQQIERRPIPARRLQNREPVGPTQAWQAISQLLYVREAWPVLATALAQARTGDASLLLLLGDPLRGRNPDGSYSNAIDAYNAITCLDWPAPRDPAAYIALATRFTRVAPRFGRLLAFNDVACAYWPTPPVRVPGPVSAPDAPPIVLVGSTGDPATPYGWAKDVARQLTSSVLVTRVGEGHTGYLVSTCVRDAVDAYLLRGTVPPAGVRCDP